jgi:uncharacterized cupin superfamily protein
MAKMQKRTFSKPDETRTFEKGKVEIIALEGITFGMATLEPGWKWSSCVKPIAKTDSCQAPHLQYLLSGRIRVKMDDGSEEEFGPGDLASIPPGHDAWIVGNDSVVAIDITGMGNYAKP